MFGEDLAFGVDDGDGVAVDVDQDVVEAVLPADQVGDLVELGGALAGQPSHDGAFGDCLGWCGWATRSGRAGQERRVGLGSWRLGLLGGLPRCQGCDPAGESLVGAFGVVDVVEGVDLGLELGQGVGQGLLVEVAEQGLWKRSFWP